MNTNNPSTSLIPVDENLQSRFTELCQQANTLQLADDVSSTFKAAAVVQALRNLFTRELVEAHLMPLMGVRIGFLTDRDKPDKNGKIPEPYTWEVVRDCVIDAACRGLAPVGNQMNIIAANMYPTKEGYSALLKRIGAKYIISKSEDKSAPGSPVARIDCKICYEYKGAKNDFTIIATPKKNAFSSLDQLQGKAERKAKKALYEYLTGVDLGDADEDSGPIDDQGEAVEVKKDQMRSGDSKNQAPTLL